MTTVPELKTKVAKLPVNLDRMDSFVNGPATGPGSEVEVDGGVKVKTIARLADEAAAEAGTYATIDGGNISPYAETWRTAIGAADLPVAASIVVTIGDGKDFPTMQAFADSLMTGVSQGGVIEAQVFGHIDVGTAQALRWSYPFGTKVKWRGQGALQRTLSNVHSVTGTPGNWSVTITLNDVAGVAVGDGVLMKNVKPGYESPYTYTTQGVRGSLRFGGTRIGRVSTFIPDGGSTATRVALAQPAGPATDFMAGNDLAILKGQPRRVQALDGTNWTINPALDSPIGTNQNLLGWWLIKNNGHTIGTTGSSTTINATSSTFQSKINPGDILLAQNIIDAFQVQSVAPDLLSIVVDHAANIPSGAFYGVITRGEMHEGAWVVSAVDAVNNRVTLTNKGGLKFPPPIHNVVGGDVTICKAKVKCRGIGLEAPFDCDGIFFEDSGGGLYGVDLRGLVGSEPGKVGFAKFGPNTGFHGFAYSVYTNGGSFLYAPGVCFSGASNGGVYLLGGAKGDMTNGIVSGVADGDAIRIGYGGSGLEAAGLRITGIKNALRILDAGSIQAENIVVCDAVTLGVRPVGGASIALNAGRFLDVGYGGVATEAGGYGSSRFSISLCNNHGFFVHLGTLDLMDSIAMGNTTGVLAKAAKVGLTKGGICGNATNITADAKSVLEDDYLSQVART
jgi:hypothetical protein